MTHKVECTLKLKLFHFWLPVLPCDVRWSKNGSEELFLYGEQYNGVIWDVAVNHSRPFNDQIFLAGTFDTVSKSSQVQLCSVASFDGLAVNKVSLSLLQQISLSLNTGQHWSQVGEGLCPRGIITTLSVTTTVLGSGGDLFVGGDFKTRVWDGHLNFVDVNYVSVFDGQ